jgi:hypothetical protein
LAFVARMDGKDSLWVRDMDSVVMRSLATKDTVQKRSVF